MHGLVLFLAIPFLLLSTSPSAIAAKPLKGFAIDLIHHDSPLSPFYNSSMTPSELIRRAAKRSISRVNHFNMALEENKAETVIIPNGGDYLMEISIGTPPVETLAVADTGSDLIWVPCLPCGQCNTQNAFDPKKSSTFSVLPCDSNQCTSLQNHACQNNSRDCIYLYAYGDQSYTIGNLATESINLGSTQGQDATFPKSVFGCGHKNQFTTTDNPTGIVGLGGGPLSLVSQLGDQIGHKFTYCLLPFTSKSTSKLKFGSEATISGNGVVSTPLYSKNPPAYYYLNLEGITVGQKTVQTGESGGNIVIDSGTTLTMLETSFYNSVAEGVKEAIGAEAVQNPPSPFNLCFQYDSASTKVPDIAFHFTGADLKFQPGNLFTLQDEFLCLLVVPNDRLSIFGNVAQIDFQVEYDLEGKKVSFAPADCTKY
ncbi:hypothetical protein L6164_003791 [Bauhinia variegata]|uniref:Uncharacterized protein n=1 Tax=Bauhinia variegata TaxID=167791 RepID=A0ACB9Q2E5_BAUVA|nr:hypothetical protein L6164_003791 [Bauhinia variegata]